MGKKKEPLPQLEPCECCNKRGIVGLEVLPYYVDGWAGQEGHIWAHSECFWKRHERYRRRKAEKMQNMQEEIQTDEQSQHSLFGEVRTGTGGGSQ